MPRGLLAWVVRYLDAAGARVIVLDVLTDRPGEDDEALARAAEAHGAVIGATRLVSSGVPGRAPFVAGPTPGLRGTLEWGYANVHAEAPTVFGGFAGISVVRAVRMVVPATSAAVTGTWPLNLLEDAEVGGEAIPRPALALAGAWRFKHMDAPQGGLQAFLTERCTGQVCERSWELGLRPPRSLTEPMPINFRGPEGLDGLPTVPASDLLRGLLMPAVTASSASPEPIVPSQAVIDAVQDRAVVVGRPLASDRYLTPYGFPDLSTADMSGHRIQAHVLDTLLSGRHVRPVPDWLVYGLSALLAGWLWRSRRTMKAGRHTLVGLGIGGAAIPVATLFYLVTDGVSMDVAPVLLVACTVVLFARAEQHLTASYASS